MIIALSIIALAVIAVFAFVNQPKFGSLPSGERLERIKSSTNYKNGSFQNLRPTPTMTEGASYWVVLKEFLFTKNKRPLRELPSMKTDLLNLDPNQNILVWFGHSSYFIQIDSKRILVDPVFSGAASPLAFTTRAFKGTDRYTPDDMPEIDYLFISHDHWDHLDYETIMKLKPKIKQVITGLGTGSHFESWGFDKSSIIEKDWNEAVILDDGVTVNVTPARHFSGRGFKPNQSLWVSFVLKTPTKNIFIGGDGGYDFHFEEIGEEFGPFDLAILENGQYNKNWKYIHMMPEQVIQAGQDLRAERIFPVHSSKFALANHGWDVPLKEITEKNKKSNIPLITPMIGELVNLNDTTQTFSKWWELD